MAEARLTEAHWPAVTEPALIEATIGDVLRAVAARHPDRVALVWGDPDPALRRSWTYRVLLEQAERLARALLRDFVPGERIAVWSANSAEYVLLQRAAALAGLILVPVDPAFQARELEYALRQAGVAGLFHADGYRGTDFAAVVAAARPGLPGLRRCAGLAAWVAGVTAASAASDAPDTSDTSDTSAAAAAAAVDLPAVAPRDPFLIQFTSGTTGYPKGALLHHCGVLNMARNTGRICALRDAEVWISPMPLSHIAGGVTIQLATLWHAGTLVLMPRFEAGLLLELVEQRRGTITLAVPTMLIAMLEHPDCATRDLSSLRTIMSGAATVDPELIRRARQRFGCAFTNVYGQTEMHGIVTMTRLDDALADQTRTIGQALPHVEMRIVDPTSGATCPVDVPGEICTRGYSSMLGYHGMPEMTAAAIDADGWLHSGDLGALDARGYLTITGKLKDLIIRGGEKIYPREVEEALFSFPGVSNVAVLGIGDARWGEQVGAVLAFAERTPAPDWPALMRHCAGRMAHYKVPVYWYRVDSFPLTPSGKIQKFALQELIATGRIALAWEARSGKPRTDAPVA